MHYLNSKRSRFRSFQLLKMTDPNIHGKISVVFFIFSACLFTTTRPYAGLVPDVGSRDLAAVIFIVGTTTLWALLVHHAAKLRALSALLNHEGHELDFSFFFFLAGTTFSVFVLLILLYNCVGNVALVRFVCWSILELVDHAGFFFAYGIGAVELAYVFMICEVFGAFSHPMLVFSPLTFLYLYFTLIITDHP